MTDPVTWTIFGVALVLMLLFSYFGEAWSPVLMLWLGAFIGVGAPLIAFLATFRHF